MSKLPDCIVHADWSMNSTKRWAARAVLQPDGDYLASPPERVEKTDGFLERLGSKASPQAANLVGFDFPIGLPAGYARKAGVSSFIQALPAFGKDDWPDFYRVAEEKGQIHLKRPFYPARPGGARQKHLIDGLEAEKIDELRRQCEMAHATRRAAAPLFWTLGGQQVGKAAICGWRELLAPALSQQPRYVRLWPFEGRLADLLQPGVTVVVETYPAEFYHRIGLDLSSPPGASAPDASRASPPRGPKRGKRSQAARAANAGRILAWAEGQGVRLENHLIEEISQGFGSQPDGEDRFDSVIGLLGMIWVLRDCNPDAPLTDELRQVEGWIFGQSVDCPGLIPSGILYNQSEGTPS